MMTIGHTVVASLMIPPKTTDFQITGHCSEHCTSLAIPPEGMNIFNILMHTHLQGIFNCRVLSLTKLFTKCV